MLNLVTGGAGFLGSHLVNALVAAGESVIIIDNLTTGHIRNLEQSISSGYATFIYGDVATTSPVLAELVHNATKERIDRVFHLASPSVPRAYNGMSWEALEANALGTLSLIELAIAHEATMLFASSAAVYGDPLIRPQQESYFGNVDPVGIRSPYEEGKRFGEAAVAAAVRFRGLDGRIVRLFDCYGPAMDVRAGLIAELFALALAGKPFPISGLQDRVVSFAYVDDVIDMLRIAMDLPDSAPIPINVGSDEDTTIGEVARMVALVAGAPFSILDDAPSPLSTRESLKPNLTVARGYGWRPMTPLPVGLKLVHDWLCSERLAFA